ncbi:hypothetical protein THAOC_30155, partial [Thalassiosira oceanica]
VPLRSCTPTSLTDMSVHPSYTHRQ